MGDVGSQFCGFVLAVLGVAAARFEAVEMSFLLVPVLLFGVLFDVAFTLVRRRCSPATGSPRRIAGICIRWRSAPGMDARLGRGRALGVRGVRRSCAASASSRASGLAKPLVLLLVLVPQLAWLGLCRPARAARGACAMVSA